jgi:hypothetical protein
MNASLSARNHTCRVPISGVPATSQGAIDTGHAALWLAREERGESDKRRPASIDDALAVLPALPALTTLTTALTGTLRATLPALSLLILAVAALLFPVSFSLILLTALSLALSLPALLIRVAVVLILLTHVVLLGLIRPRLGGANHMPSVQL